MAAGSGSARRVCAALLAVLAGAGMSRAQTLESGLSQASSLVGGGVSLRQTTLPGRPPQPPAAPAWFTRDVAKRARWLPIDVRRDGWEAASRRRWNRLPDDARAALDGLAVPSWMIALMPIDGPQDEILKQIRFIAQLAGPAPQSALARRAEQLLLFAGAAQLPTPGDSRTGESLGAEGCAAAISKYVLAELRLEFPQALASWPESLTTAQSSDVLEGLLRRAARVSVAERAFSRLRSQDIEPGSLMIGRKPGGAHVFGWTRVPAGWHWEAGDKMAVGNTGLAQFGDRMILAQEYVTDDPSEGLHNDHGPINSRMIVYSQGEPALWDPRTNVYAAQASRFVIVTFR